MRGATFAWVVALWLLLTAVALATRGLLPIDETRYASVAWEMWQRHDYWVPYLNGAPYSHKPPLLFWLIHAGWAAFGVNEWWPRLAVALASLASLGMVCLIARRLWPDQSALGVRAALILLGSILWTLFTTALYFDILLSLCVLIGVYGVALAQQRGALGWILYGAAIGLGILAKGPATFLHLLPIALLAPWWMPPRQDRSANWRNWYLGLLGAILLGGAIALAWAIPAAIKGGDDYMRAILWGQTADRMAESFAHRRAWWWYLPVLPAIVLPWTLWGAFWRGLARAAPLELNAAQASAGAHGIARAAPLLREPALRFCLAWFVPALIGFSLVSGKQPQYLLPIMPAFALIAARCTHAPLSRLQMALPAGGILLLGALLAALPWIASARPLPAWAQHISPLGALSIIALGITLFAWRSRSLDAAIGKLALASVLLVALVYLSVVPALLPAQDLRAISARLKAIEARGEPIAHAENYHAQYHFLGRLQKPFDLIDESEITAWFAAHPNGRVIVYFRPPKLPPSAQNAAVVEYSQAYRGGAVAILKR